MEVLITILVVIYWVWMIKKFAVKWRNILNGQDKRDLNVILERMIKPTRIEIKFIMILNLLKRICLIHMKVYGRKQNLIHNLE